MMNMNEKSHESSYASEFLEYGESREGYWTKDRFVRQMEMAIKITTQRRKGEDTCGSDHSSCHAAMVDNALDVSKMNVRPGGKQRIM